MTLATLDILQLLIQVPIVGLFVWFVLKNNKEWREFLKVEREEVASTHQALRQDIRGLSRTLHSLTRILLYHDMTVRGINPETSGNTKEMVEKYLRQQDPDNVK